MKRQIVILISAVFLLSACADKNLTKGQQGALGGAAGGALIGQILSHNTEGTLIGAAVGTMLGYIVGNEMDKYDREQLSRALERSPSGRTTQWVNPDTRRHYAVTPAPPVRRNNNEICRDATIVATIDGRQEVVHTTACRNKYGQWILQ